VASVAGVRPRRLGTGRFIAAVLAAPLLLVAARLLPAEGPGLAIRLAAAAACVLLLPGALLVRALAAPVSAGVAAAGALALSLAVVFLALAVTFAVHGSLALTIWIVAASALAAAVLAARARPVASARSDGRVTVAVVAGGIVFAGVLWWTDEIVRGDGLFHLARARKLAELDGLSLETTNEFRDGSLHPGYAFPLWHGVLALVARLAAVDPADVVLHLPSILAPVAFLAAYAAGAELFRSRAGGLAVLAAHVGQLGFSRDGTGSFEFLALPAATSRVFLAPVVLALAFAFVSGDERRTLVPLAAAAFALAVIHPTYVIFLAIPLGGFLVARLAFERGDRGTVARIAASLGAVVVPSGLFFLWLLPYAASSASQTPTAAERAAEIAHYGRQFDVVGDSFRFAPEALSRGGPVAIAALLAIPLAGLAARRLWAAFVLGGSLAVLAVLLFPPLFTAFSDLVSTSQSRRLAAFLPWSFAVAGASIFIARFRLLGVAVALAAGIALVVAYPGEFTYRLAEGGPAWPVWVAAVGGALAFVAGIVLRRRGPGAGTWSVAVSLAFVAPLAAVGLSNLSPPRTDAYALTPGLITELRSLEPQDVLFSHLDLSYRAAAYAPLYINAAPPAHVGDTKENRSDERRLDVIRFFSPKGATDAERRRMLAEYRADWLLIDTTRPYPERLVSSFERTYGDSRYVLFRVPSG
jgi:hypothetical protein